MVLLCAVQDTTNEICARSGIMEPCLGQQGSVMTILQIYVSADCASCATAHQRVAQVQRLRPHQPVELIDLAQIDAIRPAYIFGTPMYCLDDQVISLGN